MSPSLESTDFNFASQHKAVFFRKGPTPVFLPGESHGQGSLVGYSLQGGKRVRHDLATKQQHPSEDPQFHVNSKYSNSEREEKSQKWL